MVSKKSLLLVGAFALVLVGATAYTYACATCGCSGQAAKPAGTAQPAVTRPFTVLDVTGPAKGQKLCYICRYGGRPSFVVFTRRADGHIRHLAPAIDKLVAQNAKARLAGFVVLLGEDNQANRESLAALAKEHNLAIPLTIAPAAPKGYALPKDFDTVVLVSHRNQVRNTIAVNCAQDHCRCTKCAKVADVLHAGEHLLKNI